MRFEVVDSSGRSVMRTDYVSCIPNENQLYTMVKYGNKFKIDGKIVSLKKIKELIKNETGE